jgi:DNA-binding FadR family transcriptional regulator
VEAHRQIGKLIGARDTSGVVESMRLHLTGLSNRVHRDVVRSQLGKAGAVGRRG